MSVVSVLLDGWQQNLAAMRRLWPTLPPDRITAQPQGVVNHPAWTVSHMNHYHPAILCMARGEPVSDPGLHSDAGRYDAGSTPVDDPGLYPTPQQLWQTYLAGHERIAVALAGAGDRLLNQPPGLPRWAASFATTATILSYLMVYHEATHIGQVMVWRRAMGMAPLE